MLFLIVADWIWNVFEFYSDYGETEYGETLRLYTSTLYGLYWKSTLYLYRLQYTVKIIYMPIARIYSYTYSDIFKVMASV